MKYDVIIIGGGLSGLMAGIKLVKRGFSVAILSAGQSALHFYSGSFGLLGKIDGHEVTEPLQVIDNLPHNHPYRRIGIDAIPFLAEDAKMLLAEAGLTFTGNHLKNHYRLTPFGTCEPTWLTLTDYASCVHPKKMGWKKATIVNFKGYRDFFPNFLQDGIKANGLQCDIAEIDVPEVTHMIKDFSETRATSIAKIFKGKTLDTLAACINRAAGKSDVVFMPAVVGLESEQPIRQLKDMVIPSLMCVPTLPLSVCGYRSQICLRRYFEKLGGVFFLGDKVTKGFFQDYRLKEIETANLEDIHLRADHFILSTGSFFSQGLVSTPECIYEPTLNADVLQTQTRIDWCSKNILEPQRFMEFGVDTDENFRIKISGHVIENVYAAGSVLGGANPVQEGSGGGIAILTALHVAHSISRFAHIIQRIDQFNKE